MKYKRTVVTHDQIYEFEFDDMDHRPEDYMDLRGQNVPVILITESKRIYYYRNGWVKKPEDMIPLLSAFQKTYLLMING